MLYIIVLYKIGDKIMKEKILSNLKTAIYLLLLIYSGFYMLATTDPVWFVLVTMLAFKFSDELDNNGIW